MKNKKTKLDIIAFLSKIIIVAITSTLLFYSLYFISDILLTKYIKEPPKIEINIYGSDKKNEKLSDQLNQKYKEEILNSIKTRYEETVSLLNLTIDIFAISATLFLALIGLFSFNQIKKIIQETRYILDQAEELPEKIIKSYNENQLPELMNRLFAENLLERSDAIQKIFNNPEVKINHLFTIKQSLENEFSQKHNPYFYANISFLSNILIKLDVKKAKDIFYNLIKDKLEDRKNNALLNHFINLHESDDESLVKNMLLNQDTNFLNSLISILFNSGKLTDNYAAFIIENCNEQTCLFLFNYLTLYPELFREEVIVEAYQKRKIDKRGILQSILTGVINPKFSFSSKKKLIEYFINSEDKIDEIFNLLSLYLIKIESDMPSLEELFKSISKSSKMKEILDKLIPYLKIRKWQRIDVIQGIIPEYFL